MLAFAAIPPAFAQTSVRVATYNTELSRKGPGLLLRDIRSETDEQVEAAARVIAYSTPDVILLQGVDYDHDLVTLRAFRDRIDAHGWYFAHVFAARPNSGLATGVDLDGDGRLGAPRDAQGYGEFAGQGGMAIMSRYPIRSEALRDHSARLWHEMPDALLTQSDGTPVLTDAAMKVQRLSTVGHWDVPVEIEGRSVRLLAFHASPPVFDGPEDRNGRRNHDEIVFWQHVMDGLYGPPPQSSFVVLGDANLDPIDGDGRKSAIHRLLDDSRLIDPEPRKPGPVAQGPGHVGDPALDTVAWPEPDPGSLRVSYVLPSADLRVLESGIFDPPADAGLKGLVSKASRHRLVWVDLQIE
ncbi:MAG: endonuclease/exonuclease/phosphatase family protein [Pseudomonadota bacterium]